MYACACVSLRRTYNGIGWLDHRAAGTRAPLFSSLLFGVARAILRSRCACRLLRSMRVSNTTYGLVRAAG